MLYLVCASLLRSMNLSNIDVAVVGAEKTCSRRRSVRVQKFVSGMPEKGGHLTFGHKFALAVGAGPITLPLISTTVYIQMFLLDVARVLPMYATTIIVVARILDAVTDPTVGALVNKTQDKGGSLRKWMLFSLPISILSFFFLWYVPPTSLFQSSTTAPPLTSPDTNGGFAALTARDDYGNNFLFIYYLLIYTLLQLAFTLYSIPFCSLVMYQSTDESERDAAVSFRLVGEAFFAILSLGIVRFAEMLTHSGSLDNVDCGEHTGGTVDEDVIERYQQTFVIQGALGSLVILLSGLYCFLGSMENTDIHIEATVGMLGSFKNAMTFKPYILLALAYLAGYVAVNITQGCLLLYFKYVIRKESLFTVAMLVLVFSGALSIPLWKFLITRYGKRKVSFCAVVITVPAFSMLSVISKQVSTPALMAFAMFTGPGCACGFYIPWVLLPDVIDAYTVQFGQRNESIFYGFFVFLSKLAAGCVTGGTMGTLKLLEYDASKCEQNESVNIALRVICAVCPTVLLILFGVIMYFFPLSEQKMEENRKFLQKKFFSHAAHLHSADGVTVTSLGGSGLLDTDREVNFGRVRSCSADVSVSPLSMTRVEDVNEISGRGLSVTVAEVETEADRLDGDGEEETSLIKDYNSLYSERHSLPSIMGVATKTHGSHKRQNKSVDYHYHHPATNSQQYFSNGQRHPSSSAQLHHRHKRAVSDYATQLSSTASSSHA